MPPTTPPGDPPPVPKTGTVKARLTVGPYELDLTITARLAPGQEPDMPIPLSLGFFLAGDAFADVTPGPNPTPTPTPTPPSLAALTLSSSTVPERTAPGVVVGIVEGRTTGSTLVLQDNAGGRFALSGNSLLTGPVATNYTLAGSHAVTFRETLVGSPNSPRDTIRTITVTDVPDAPATGELIAEGGTERLTITQLPTFAAPVATGSTNQLTITG